MANYRVRAREIALKMHDEWIGGASVDNYSRHVQKALEEVADRAQWRRVEDWLPEDGSRVLVKVQGDDPETQLAYVDGADTRSWLVESYAEWGQDGNTITHWRPLPEGPE